jgi:DNA (cytosine-5)-methyltransferase 1
MKILNLYACLGGNRYKWDEVEDVEVTAVELDPYASELYQERFPNDTVIVADAHQYLLDHYKEFDFIWSSPPCPSHSRARFWNSSNYESNTKPIYPDMGLYQEILFLQNYYKGNWAVENVIPFYKPLIQAQKVDRHLFWSNLNLKGVKGRDYKIVEKGKEMPRLISFHDYDFRKYKGDQFIYKIARNLVDYQVGKQILEIAVGKFKQDNQKQGLLF